MEPKEKASNRISASTRIIPGTNAWAVGNILSANGNAQTLIEQFSGTSWGAVSAPSPGSGDNFLGGAAATPAGDVWAVGGYSNKANTNSLTLHYC